MPASVVKRLVFHCTSMNSSEDEAQSPELGASSSKDPPPPLESGDAFTTPSKKCRPIPSGSQALPSDSDAESNESENISVCKKSRSYKRPQIEWENVVSFVKGDEATMDEDEMKSKVRAATKNIMEDSRMIRLPSHVTRPGDEGLWKEIRSYKTDRGKTLVRWFRCPMSYRFRCKCQIKIYDGALNASMIQRTSDTFCKLLRVLSTSTPSRATDVRDLRSLRTMRATDIARDRSITLDGALSIFCMSCLPVCIGAIFTDSATKHFCL